MLLLSIESVFGFNKERFTMPSVIVTTPIINKPAKTNNNMV